jgi:5-methylcytosine-specific restriction endonuclease McrA
MTAPRSTAALERAERLITRAIGHVAPLARQSTVRVRGAEMQELQRTLAEARQEVLAAKGDPVRTAIPAALRARVLARANGHCEACGAALDPAATHIDHVIPVARYGATTDDNLRATCARCNLEKGAQ